MNVPSAALLVFALTLPAAAQQPAPSPSPVAPAEASAEREPGSEPDISITATVRWKTLQFEVAGTPRVDLKGAPGTTVWEAERINLPRPVQPGVTYRDGEVRLRIETSFAEMVDSALAELQAPKVTAPAAEPPR